MIIYIFTIALIKLQVVITRTMCLINFFFRSHMLRVMKIYLIVQDTGVSLLLIHQLNLLE